MEVALKYVPLIFIWSKPLKYLAPNKYVVG